MPSALHSSLSGQLILASSRAATEQADFYALARRPSCLWLSSFLNLHSRDVLSLVCPNQRDKTQTSSTKAAQPTLAFIAGKVLPGRSGSMLTIGKDFILFANSR